MNPAKADPSLKGCLYSPNNVAKHSNWMFQFKCARTIPERRSARKGLLAEGSSAVYSLSVSIQHTQGQCIWNPFVAFSPCVFYSSWQLSLPGAKEMQVRCSLEDLLGHNIRRSTAAPSVRRHNVNRACRHGTGVGKVGDILGLDILSLTGFQPLPARETDKTVAPTGEIFANSRL